ncbi:MAG TPA: hypothetical protein EYP62_07610 [Kiritimatiellae bacterium]|nr:hypothetical protein [Kiritimatiellia bacterium]
MNATRHPGIIVILVAGLLPGVATRGETNRYLLDIPAYDWHYGCFGTASGILMGYWDRNGFPNMYTGPTANGIAPLTNSGTNSGIRSLWATQAAFDGRSATNYGHVDDYWITYESEDADPWHTRGCEHPPDCVGDFIGLNQNRWTNLNSECNGNRDGWAFNYFDTSGARRVNFTPGPEAGLPARDVQSGLRAYAQYRGYTADSFSQLVDIWTDTPPGQGFTFQDVVREIEAGYPLLLMLQDHIYCRTSGYNPDVHALVVCGYRVTDDGLQQVRVRTGWTTDTNAYDLKSWAEEKWYSWFGSWPRGAIGFHPRPQVSSVSRSGATIIISWAGPQARLYDAVADAVITLHWYVVEGSSSLSEPSFKAISPAVSALTLTLTNLADNISFLRVRHLESVNMPDTNLRHAVENAITDKYGPVDTLFDLDLEGLFHLQARQTNIVRLDGLEYAVNLTNLDLEGNLVTQLDALVLNCGWSGLGYGDRVCLSNNPLNDFARTNQIPYLTNHGVRVYW